MFLFPLNKSNLVTTTYGGISYQVISIYAPNIPIIHISQVLCAHFVPTFFQLQ